MYVLIVRVVADKIKFKAVFLGDVERIPDSHIVRFKAEYAAHECLVRAVTLVGLGKRAVKREGDSGYSFAYHLSCKQGN